MTLQDAKVVQQFFRLSGIWTRWLWRPYFCELLATEGEEDVPVPGLRTPGPHVCTPWPIMSASGSW